MPLVISILLGAVFTVATAIAIGSLLLRVLAIDLYREERWLFAFISGSALLSLMVFLLASTGLARKGVFLAAGILATAAALRYRPRGEAASFPPLPRLLKWLFAAAFAAFSVYYLLTALEPEYSPDGVAYHLHFVNQYNRAHGFVRISNFYSNLSQGIELLFLFAFAFGRHSSAALVHFSFLIFLALSILSYGRRAGYPLAGMCAALLVYTCPVAAKDATCAYIDVAVTAILFAVFYLLEIWDGQRKTALLLMIGLLAGFGYAAKYTAFLAVLYAAGFVLWRTRSWKPAAIVTLCSLLLIVPWVAKNVLWTGNPFSPFFNQLFPNPVVYTFFERDWTTRLKMYTLQSRWQIPLELAFGGTRLGGLIGPLFLLLPVGLLSLRSRAGRRLLFAGTLFFLPYFLNIGARFVIPALPFFALALALALSRYPLVLAALSSVACVVAWPSVVPLYSDPYAWRLQNPSWQAALRVQSQDDYLSWDPNYTFVKRIDDRVPAGARIFSLSGLQQAYSNRTFLSGFLSAESEVLVDIYQCASFPIFNPAYLRTFQFARGPVRAIRLVQTATTEANQPWSIAEIRLYDAGRELPRTADWRLTARPNPWDIGMAFDNDPVTRWRSWQAYEPGMFIEIDLGKTEQVDSVQVLSSLEQTQTRIKIETMDGGGRWQAIPATVSESNLSDVGFLGKRAMSAIRARNIQYFFLKNDDFEAEKVLRDPGAWGLTQIDQFADGRLYRIDAR